MQKVQTQRLSLPQALLFGFLSVIVFGAALLMLPYSTVKGISLVDALFTSTSAVCVTGLIVKNTNADFTLFGQIVILVLIQVGGLGYMSFATLIALITGRRIGIYERMVLKESFNLQTHEGIVRFIKRILIFVFSIESIGVLLIYITFSTQYSSLRALFLSLVHTISAFNNAGFSLFENSFIDYRTDLMINLTLMGLIITGGLGFVVLNDVYENIREKKRLTEHTKTVLLVTIILISIGAVLFYLNERNFLMQGRGLKEISLISLFSSVTARTAGFNTIDYSKLQPSTLFLTIILMIIGASPGGTGGGIKTTTFVVITLHILATLKGRRDTVIFRRRIPQFIISRALVILSLSVFYVTFVTFLIENIEHRGFLITLFEVVSAFATVGLSVGDGGSLSFVATFSDLSKVIIMITMLVGRIGPLTLFMALVSQREEKIHYPPGRIIIG